MRVWLLAWAFQPEPEAQVAVAAGQQAYQSWMLVDPTNKPPVSGLLIVGRGMALD
jgi:hypothetical protein